MLTISRDGFKTASTRIHEGELRGSGERAVLDDSSKRFWSGHGSDTFWLLCSWLGSQISSTASRDAKRFLSAIGDVSFTRPCGTDTPRWQSILPGII